MDGLDKSLPFSEGMISAEDAAKSQSQDGPRHCLNCGTALTDTYCPHCGQKDLPKRQTLGELLSNFVSSFWSFESKFFKTGLLLLKPGFLATEYTEGRRERYYHPARMYVFISFIYFLLLSALPENNDQSDPDYNKGSLLNVKGDPFSLDSAGYTSLAQYDSIQQTKNEGERDGWFRRLFRKREIILKERYKDNFKGFEHELSDAFIANFPKIFFFLLPIFAFIFKLLYIRRDFYFSEHLVFSIYYYNFFFLAGSVYLLFDKLPWLEWCATLIGFWIILYLLFAMKKMYKQGWWKTIFKYCAFLTLFSVFVGVGMLVNLMITLLYI